MRWSDYELQTEAVAIFLIFFGFRRKEKETPVLWTGVNLSLLALKLIMVFHDATWGVLSPFAEVGSDGNEEGKRGGGVS